MPIDVTQRPRGWSPISHPAPIPKKPGPFFPRRYKDSIVVSLVDNAATVPGVALFYSFSESSSWYPYQAGAGIELTTNTEGSSTTPDGTTPKRIDLTVEARRTAFANSRRISCSFELEKSARAETVLSFPDANLGGLCVDDQAYLFPAWKAGGFSGMYDKIGVELKFKSPAIVGATSKLNFQVRHRVLATSSDPAADDAQHWAYLNDGGLFDGGSSQQFTVTSELLKNPLRTTLVEFISAGKESDIYSWSHLQTERILLIKTRTPRPEINFGEPETLVHQHAHWFPDDPDYGRMLSQERKVFIAHGGALERQTGTNGGPRRQPELLFVVFKQGAIALEATSVPTLNPTLSDGNVPSLAKALTLPVARKDYGGNAREECSHGTAVSEGHLHFDTVCSFNPGKDIRLWRGDQVVVYSRQLDEVVSDPVLVTVPGDVPVPVGGSGDFLSVQDVVSASRLVVSGVLGGGSSTTPGRTFTTTTRVLPYDPTKSNVLRVAFSQASFRRKYCVHVEGFSLAGSPPPLPAGNRCVRNPRGEFSSPSSGTPRDDSGFLDFSPWHLLEKDHATVSSPVQISLDGLVQSVFNLNLTLYTSVKKPGYLWSRFAPAGPPLLVVNERAPAAIIIKMTGSQQLHRKNSPQSAGSSSGGAVVVAAEEEESFYVWSAAAFYQVCSDHDEPL